jgi:hypothetical protein
MQTAFYVFVGLVGFLAIVLAGMFLLDYIEGKIMGSSSAEWNDYDKY